VLIEKLRPVSPPPTPSRKPLLQVQEKSVQEVWEWWNGVGRPLHDYTLDGANWELLFPGDNTRPTDRPAKLRAVLQQPERDEGKLVWYRLFGLACLMSGAGHGRIESLRRFWREELDCPERNFWNVTADRDFHEATKDLFLSLVLRRANPDATREWADFWRHVFYDVRKVHELVWNREFADTVLRLICDPGRVAHLPQFLRDGQLPGQQSWDGVLGQSAGVPLFFLTREMCRLGLAPAGEIQRLAFFVCTPVRRAAERIGWLKTGASEQADFRSLARMSEQLYDTIMADARFGAKLLPDYDIPLLHLGLTE
jgi:hypothetical protein